MSRDATMPIVLTLCAISARFPLDGYRADPVPPASVSSRATLTAQARPNDVQLLATWNEIALRTTAAGPFSPPRETRALAMVSWAVFDAVNAITHRYEARAASPPARTDASIAAATSAAARRTLVTLYPPAKAKVDAAYDSLLALVPNGSPKDAGIAVGIASADAVLAARAQDHALDSVSYTPGNGVGVWTPTPPAFVAALEPRWGSVTPFYARVGSEFRPTPPPPVGSAKFMQDLLEIRVIGHGASTTRTRDQTEAARFWIATAPQLWNQVVRQLTASGVDVTAAARVYMVMNLAGADAMIAAWDAKYAYNQWRPVTGIRSRDVPGLTTHPDTGWSPLLATPPFPDYPAGHSAYAGAAEVVLRALTGKGPVQLVITSPTAIGGARHYRSVAEIAEEVVNARVWGGVHWRTSSVVGRELGNKVGKVAIARMPRPTDSNR